MPRAHRLLSSLLHDAECRSELRNVSSVDKALQVLLLLAREPTPLGVREIGRRLELSPPTVHRLLATLASYDLAEYRLGWACLGLGRAVLSGTEIGQVAPEIAHRLRDATEETVTAQVRVGKEQVVVVEAEGLHELRRRVGIGRRMPLHAGASGRAILAFLSPAEIDAYLSKPLARVGPNTVTDPDALGQRLAEVRERGYTTSHQESVVGVAAASVPIFGQDGEVAGSLSVSGAEARIGPDLETRIVPLLVEAGLDLSRALGYRSEESRQPVPAGT
jgi:DNA-binding IclR family transcriptional regulator